MSLKLCVDFDGVLHSYTSGWQGVHVAADPPVPGAIDWLHEVVDAFNVAIYSSRSSDPVGIRVMQDWLRQYGFDPDKVAWPTTKPAAFLTIDDRAWQFDGTFPAPETIRAFKPWHRS